MICIGGSSDGLNVSRAHKDDVGRVFDLQKPYQPDPGKYIRPSRRTKQSVVIESYVVRKLTCDKFTGYFLVFTSLTDQAATQIAQKKWADQCNP